VTPLGDTGQLPCGSKSRFFFRQKSSFLPRFRGMSDDPGREVWRADMRAQWGGGYRFYENRGVWGPIESIPPPHFVSNKDFQPLALSWPSLTTSKMMSRSTLTRYTHVYMYTSHTLYTWHTFTCIHIHVHTCIHTIMYICIYSINTYMVTCKTYTFVYLNVQRVNVDYHHQGHFDVRS